MRGTAPLPSLTWALYASTLVIATCGLVYELVAGALASYLLGDSITQFSLVIGTYLSAMGFGAYLSRFVERGLLARFVEIELMVALVGGFEAPLLFASFTYGVAFRPVLFVLVFVVGSLVGLELPLLLRLLEQHTTLKDLVSRVLFLDYVGALFASVAFPVLLVPHLGLMRTSLAFGIFNALVALATTFVFDEKGPVARLRVLSALVLAVLVSAFLAASDFERTMENHLFADPVMLSVRSPYQHIVVTHRSGDTRLFLDGALQFSSSDEHRYHEALVHPPLATRMARGPLKRVLVLGGGDGLAVREILRWPTVEQVVLVDLDAEITALFRERPELIEINEGALNDPRVTVVNDDAFVWLRDPSVGLFDAAVIDFPDPNDYGLGKLYTAQFYRLLTRRLSEGAVLSVQSTSPMYSPNAYWCIVGTLAYEGFVVKPYHAYVPAFGEWGFVLASREAMPQAVGLPEGLRFLDDALMQTLFEFPLDMSPRELPVNRLDNQVLVRLYEQDWTSLGLR